MVKQSSTKLHSMWKDVNNKFIQTKAKFTQSGMHDSDFCWTFCMGRSDVLYLHEWLKLKPQLTDFVNGGWLEEEGYTSFSTDDVIASSKRSSTGSCTAPKKKKTRGKSEGDDVTEKVTAVLQNIVSVQQATEKRNTSNDIVKAQADTLSREQQSQLHHMTMLKEV